MPVRLGRRRFLGGAAALAAASGLAARKPLDAVTRSGVLAAGEDLTRATQRFLLSPRSLGREFTAADISPAFRANGSTIRRMPTTWRLPPKALPIGGSRSVDW
jgi:hypothetical protein